MSKCHVEIDFFELEKRKAASRASSPQSRTASSGTKSAGGIQSVVSRVNPQLLRKVMAAGAAMSSDTMGPLSPSEELFPSSNPSSPAAAGDASVALPPPLIPVINPSSRCSSCVRPVAETAPLTIFYNGTVTTFGLPRDKAEAIMRTAEWSGIVGTPVENRRVSFHDGSQLERDLPIVRRKSLERFLEKRRERYRHHPLKLFSLALTHSLVLEIFIG